MTSIVHKNIVIKREQENIVLPVFAGGILPIPNGLPVKDYILLRTMEWHEQTGVLFAEVQHDVYTAAQYEQSRKYCDGLFAGVPIEKIILTNPRKHALEFHPAAPLTSGELASYTAKNELTERRAERDVSSAASAPVAREENVYELISVHFKDISFDHGKVCFRHYIPAAKRQIHFEILNSFVIKEYEAIKHYFIKALAVKRINCQITLQLLDGKISTRRAESPDIARITPDLIDKISERVFFDEVSRAPDDVIDFPEVLHKVSAVLGLPETDEQPVLLKKLLSKTKHFFHLSYLSKQHQSQLGKLRITGKPLSFIFLLNHQNNFYLVWETYSTEEATYVWRLNGCRSISEVQIASERIKEQIIYLRRGNKTAFLKNPPEGFTRIEHQYVGDDNGFKKWREELIDFMTR